jgi:hypothetical protein
MTNEEINRAFEEWFKKTLKDVFNVIDKLDTTRLGFGAGVKWMQAEQEKKRCENCKFSKDEGGNYLFCKNANESINCPGRDFYCKDWQFKESEGK